MFWHECFNLIADLILTSLRLLLSIFYSVYSLVPFIVTIAVIIIIIRLVKKTK